MQRRGDEPRVMTSEPALRVIMRRLREIMSEPGDGQARLDKIVKQIAGVMVTEVCSIYLKRQDGSLELFASEGLNPGAVHATRMKRGEGLVGRCAELNITINEPEASSHPAFSYRPETGEEIYHSLLAVPIQRSGQVLGVLVVQNRTQKEYSDEDVEVLQATAMVVAEHLVSGAVAGRRHGDRAREVAVGGDPGRADLRRHRARATSCCTSRASSSRKLMAEDPAEELIRLETAIATLRASLDEMFDHEHLSGAGEHRDVLEAYRMFAHDRGWERRLREAVEGGLTAEAAVERVQNGTRARMLRQNDAYWRERQRDLDDLSDRLLRILAGRVTERRRALGRCRPTPSSSRAPWARRSCSTTTASGCAGSSWRTAAGRATLRSSPRRSASPPSARRAGIVERVTAGDAAIVDATTGEVHLRPVDGRDRRLLRQGALPRAPAAPVPRR